MGSSSSLSGIARRLHGLTPATAAMIRDAGARVARDDIAGAERLMMGVLALAPAHAETLRLSGLIDHRRGRLAEAGESYRRALDIDPNDAAVLAQWGELKMDQREGEGGLALLRRACEIDPDDADLWLRLGIQLDREGRHQDALLAGARVVAIDPAHAVARLLLARNLQALGRIDEAATEYRKVIAKGGARTWQAWFGLVDLKTTRLQPKETQALEKLARDASISADARSAMHFALGKVYEDAARYPEALRSFQQANAARRQTIRWSASGFSRDIAALIDAFDALPLAAHANGDRATRQGSEVIFVIGMPRSGTTLVEQVLAAHPEVEGASELPDLAAVMGEESNRRGKAFPGWVTQARDEDWLRLGREYLERTARWRQQRPRSTDKLPDNWTMIDSIVRMLPGAVIVDCRRDALETCWSCYKQMFARGRADYSYDLEELASYFGDYIRFTDRAAEKYPSSVWLQGYESLVADPESQIRALLDFCDLPFDASCLQFHQSKRAVRTPSSAQVRSPLASGTARALLYGNLLEEFKRRLGKPAPSART
jgi:tetratricopeptide (TPR) repeat protein